MIIITPFTSSIIIIIFIDSIDNIILFLCWRW